MNADFLFSEEAKLYAANIDVIEEMQRCYAQEMDRFFEAVSKEVLRRCQDTIPGGKLLAVPEGRKWRVWRSAKYVLAQYVDCYNPRLCQPAAVTVQVQTSPKLPAEHRPQVLDTIQRLFQAQPGITIGPELAASDICSYTVACDRTDSVGHLARAISDLAPELFRLEDLAPA